MYYAEVFDPFEVAEKIPALLVNKKTNVRFMVLMFHSNTFMHNLA